MGFAEANISLSVQDYLMLERTSPTKNEFYKGQLIPMAGASLNHNRITSNLFLALHEVLEIFGSDMRLGLPPEWESYFYPDLTVVEGLPSVMFDDNLTNPSIIVEVLSKSTKDKDRGPKFGLYRQIPTLKEYIMISSEVTYAERYSRMDEYNWGGCEYSGLDGKITLPNYGVELNIQEVYKGASFIVQ